MALNTVTVAWDENDPTLAGLTGTITFVLSAVLTDTTDGLIIHPVPKAYPLALGKSQPLVANDNSAALPTGSFYTITIQTSDGAVYSFEAFVNFANGATQKLSSLVPIVTQPSMLASLPLPSGTPLAGQVPLATGTGEASAWGSVLPLQAETTLAGYTLVNGTGNIITWTAPNDGALHRFLATVTLNVTSADTGGALFANWTTPGSGAGSSQLLAAARGLGVWQSQVVGHMQPGTTVSVVQNTALTAGASVAWATIFAL